MDFGFHGSTAVLITVRVGVSNLGRDGREVTAETRAGKVAEFDFAVGVE